MRIDAARMAGLTYLIVVAAGLFSLAYVPAQVPLAGDPTSVIASISAREAVFRAGIAAGLACYVAFLVLPLTLYRVFRDVDRAAAVLMVALATASVPLSFASLVARFGLLAIAHDTTLPADIVASQATDAVREARDFLLMAQLFWGLWLLPLGWMILKSASIPRVFGVFLILGGFGYVATVIGMVLVPDFGTWWIGGWLRRPAAIGEIGTALWLTVMGARRLTLPTTAP